METTKLFHDIVFGPIKSRRLGVSLGVNLLPVDGKVCTYDCAYCECGFNAQGKGGRLPNRSEVAEQLGSRLRQMHEQEKPLDVITFAGNGEPTVHPDFAAIIDDTILLRDRYYPAAKVSVLSNATRLAIDSVREALLKVDNNILKLDSACQETVSLMNNPSTPIQIERIIDQLAGLGGKVIIQTMFLRGEIAGEKVDNTTPEEVSMWLDAIIRINPKKIMIYSIDRPTPAKTLEKVSRIEMERIAQLAIDAGFEVSIA